MTQSQNSHSTLVKTQPELTIELVKRYSKQNLMKHRKSSEQFYRCLICSDVATFPVQCCGCKAVFCKKCAEKWEQQSRKCPQKCSKAWEYMQIDNSKTELRCPYSQQCPQTLFPQTYQPHLLICPHIPPSIKFQLDLKTNFKCDSNHPLTLINGKFQQLINLPCHSCNHLKLCRSECRECSTMFCLECRPLPFVRERCWNKKHRYVYVKSDEDAVCDVCENKPYHACLGSYEDRVCNTNICERCYHKLPLSVVPTKP